MTHEPIDGLVATKAWQMPNDRPDLAKLNRTSLTLWLIFYDALIGFFSGDWLTQRRRK
jgi:hypothetical protein